MINKLVKIKQDVDRLHNSVEYCKLFYLIEKIKDLIDILIENEKSKMDDFK